ncbi:hypothetical protein NGM10_01625 [Halorussus salilacus]|uniref:hypothetical protein n=1 Tax=Halorussus salilacus TaxID=2953750 RepID=UPI00209D15A7|nr:hypothetical protein [Halorussus salilacus]USZ68452.1 hypothetical protein NGM10_01625 [Halorussus salilacus]
MSDISAREALRYATDDEMLKLYGVLVGGWSAMAVGEFVARTSVQAGVRFLALAGVVAGALAVLAGVVAIAYKVLAEGRPT